MRPASTLALLLAACAPPAPAVPPDSRPAPVPSDSSVAPVPADSPSAPPPASEPPAAAPPPAAPTAPPVDPPTPELLGQPRAAVAARLGPRTAIEGRWHRHAAADVQFDKNRCVRVRRVAPAGLDCLDVAAWAGYPDSKGFPLRHTDGCEWPGISDRHRLAPGIAAYYHPSSGRFEVWLLD